MYQRRPERPCGNQCFRGLRPWLCYCSAYGHVTCQKKWSIGGNSDVSPLVTKWLVIALVTVMWHVRITDRESLALRGTWTTNCEWHDCNVASQDCYKTMHCRVLHPKVAKPPHPLRSTLSVPALCTARAAVDHDMNVISKTPHTDVLFDMIQMSWRYGTGHSTTMY